MRTQRRWTAPIDMQAAPDAKRRRIMEHLNAKAPSPGTVAGALVNSLLGVHERILGRLGGPAPAQLAQQNTRDVIDTIGTKIAHVERLYSGSVDIGAPLHVQGHDSYLTPAPSAAPIVAGDPPGIEERQVRLGGWTFLVSATRMDRPLDIVDGHLRVLQLTYLRVRGTAGAEREAEDPYVTASGESEIYVTAPSEPAEASERIAEELREQLAREQKHVQELRWRLEQVEGLMVSSVGGARRTIAELRAELVRERMSLQRLTEERDRAEGRASLYLDQGRRIAASLKADLDVERLVSDELAEDYGRELHATEDARERIRELEDAIRAAEVNAAIQREREAAKENEVARLLG